MCLAYDWFVIARVNPFVLLQRPRSSVKKHHSQVAIYLLLCSGYNDDYLLHYVCSEEIAVHIGMDHITVMTDDYR